MSNRFFKSWYKNKSSQSNKKFDGEVSFIEKLPNYGYYGFRLYFPEESKNYKIFLLYFYVIGFI